METRCESFRNTIKRSSLEDFLINDNYAVVQNRDLIVLLQEDVEPYYEAYRTFTKLLDESPIQVSQ